MDRAAPGTTVPRADRDRHVHARSLRCGCDRQAEEAASRHLADRSVRPVQLGSGPQRRGGPGRRRGPRAGKADQACRAAAGRRRASRRARAVTMPLSVTLRAAFNRITLACALVGLGVLLVGINIASAIMHVRIDRDGTEQRALRDMSNLSGLLSEQTAAALEAVDLVL